MDDAKRTAPRGRIGKRFGTRHGGCVIDREALRREAQRVQLRYSIEVVEAFDFCPWARSARETGRVRTVVLFGSEPATSNVVAVVRGLGADPQPEIGLLLFPELVLGRVAFQHLAAAVRARLEAEGDRTFAIADFHPDAELDLASPERLVAFVRRSPDPTLQLVRRSALDAARLTPDSGTRFLDPAQLARAAATAGSEVEPVHARIARNNQRTVAGETARVAAVLDEISRDRNQSYAALGLPQPPWAK
jgi:hypothetical protein